MSFSKEEVSTFTRIALIIAGIDPDNINQTIEERMAKQKTDESQKAAQELEKAIADLKQAQIDQNRALQDRIDKLTEELNKL